MPFSKTLLLRGLVLASAAGLTAWHGWWWSPCRREAQAAYARGDVTTALRRALDQLARRPADAEAARIAARCLSHLIYGDEAEAYYRIAERRGRLALEDLQVRALGLTRSNRPVLAVRAYEEILARDPDNPTALQRLAALHWLRFEIKDALALAQRLAEVPSHAVVGHAMLGEIHHDPNRNPGRLEDPERRPDLAVAAFQKVLELDPRLKAIPYSQTIFWKNFASDLLVLGRTQEARDHLLEHARRLDDPALFDLLGHSYFLEGDTERARRWWTLSSEKDPGRVGPWVNLGRIALQEGRPQEALEYLRRAVELDGSHYRSLQLLGSAYTMLGRTDEARRYQKLSEAARLARDAAGSASTADPDHGSAPAP